MKRRPLLAWTALGLGAVGAGLLAYRSQQSKNAPATDLPATAASATTAVDTAQAAADWWQTPFATLDGPPLVPIQRFGGRPLLLNFWATWCPPCVKELPDIAQFLQEASAQHWQGLALAVDEAQAVRDFLTRTPVHLPIALAGAPGIALSRGLGNTRGGLPFSVAFDAQGRLFWRKLGAAHRDELHQMARQLSST
ncbi:TlpA disulfide reductase family protein [Roseateles sp. BYS180W]|uniref:TlpA disulfide reductase family protein n=1 Tax=Roseateles rivi TaxID=3299028 RepID=A0ABW7FW73_9BURK